MPHVRHYFQTMTDIFRNLSPINYIKEGVQVSEYLGGIVCLVHISRISMTLDSVVLRPTSTSQVSMR